MLVQSWKLPHIVKGTLTYVPVINAWRRRRAATGGTDSPDYCYSVWLRHLLTLIPYGFRIKGSSIAELGPGDSIGTGLAALLSGADHYVGLDVMPYSGRCDLELIFDKLIDLYLNKSPIPSDTRFSRVRPRLDSYEFPANAIEWSGFYEKIQGIRADIKGDLSRGHTISYHAPWTSFADVPSGSLDLVFSQATLEYCVSLEEAYGAIAKWLKPGGYCSHTINFGATYLSPFWNGHWAYSDWQWRLARGRREVFPNREPLHMHLFYAKQSGFEILLVKKDYTGVALKIDALSPRFQTLPVDDLQTSGVSLVLKKKADGRST
jgi:SAM-dependent methyltransferase